MPFWLPAGAVFPLPIQALPAPAKTGPGAFAVLTGRDEYSMYAHEQPIPTHRPRPAPELPRGRVIDREEDDLRAPDQIFGRHVTHWAGHDARVRRIVPVVAHHEITPGRHLVDRSEEHPSEL